MPIQILENIRDFAYVLYPTKHEVYDDFPLEGLSLKHGPTKTLVAAKFVQLTKAMAFREVDGSWWKFAGPFSPNAKHPAEDEHWKWVHYIRKLRKREIFLRCVAIRTEDGRVQGAAIYSRAGASHFEPGKRALYLHYLATAPRCRANFAKQPLYSGVGEGLLILAITHSLYWGYEGRVILFSLPDAVKFYLKYDFQKTGIVEDRMIQLELPSNVAQKLLKKEAVI